MPLHPTDTVSPAPAAALQVILRNARWLLGSTILVQGLSLLSGILLTRYLQASGYGQYAFSYTYAWFISMFIIAGTRGSMLRYVPQHPETSGRYMVQVVLVRVATAAIALSASLVFGLAIDKPLEVQITTAIFVLMAGTDAVFLAAPDLFRGREDMRYEAIFTVAERLLVVVAVAVAAWARWPLSWIAGAIFAISLGRALLFTVPLRRCLPAEPVRFDPQLLRYLAADSPQYLLVDLASAVTARADVLVLAALATDAQVGCFHASNTVVMAMQVLPTMLTMAMQPTTARLAVADQTTMFAAKVGVARWALGLFLPVVGLLAAVAPALMIMLFGPTFAAAGTVMRWLTLTLPLIYLNGLAANAFFVTSRQMVNFWVALATAVVGVSCNVLLVPVYGAVGAAQAAIAAHLTGFVINYRLGCADFGPPILAAVPKPLLSGLVGFGATVVSFEPMGWMSLGVGAVAALVIPIVTGDLRWQDVQRAMALLKGYGR